MKNITQITLVLFLTISCQLLSQSIATYNITFQSTWNATDHTSIPPNAHWSKLVGSNHNSNVSFLEVGSMASLGIEMIAESGNNVQFETVDVENAINAGNAQQYINGSSLGSASGTITIDGLEVSEEFPLLTLVSMVAPSPDWMVAIHDLELLESTGNWKSSINIPMTYVYDAGTDTGTDYTSGNADSNLPISVFNMSNSIAPFNGNAIGNIEITLTNVLGINHENSSANMKLFPNPSQGYVTITNSTNLETIEIYNILGKIVQETPITNTSKVQLDLSNLQKGLYLVKLKNINKNSVTQKLILK
ncbi:spondin domain-containing protein [Xanthomarina sp. GH4-25]|uniref:T9SS type A sorting domain-containing protein n=1 Tax=Xanthomarina sp. GH4-25 TaxID=3349335 RepID=UPI000D676ACF|nr:hypothetical protein DI383_06650 [Flavobacteriaceae bacterium LYZ1037]